MIVLDASVLIAYLDSADAHHARSTNLLAREIDQDLAISTLTLAEVLVAPARTGRMSAVLAALDDLGVRELPLPAGAAPRLAAMRVAAGLRMPDCCVLLAAQDADARVASFDGRLLVAATDLGLTVVPD